MSLTLRTATAALTACAGLALLGAGGAQAITFDPTAPATITESFTSTNLQNFDKYFQLKFTTNGAGIAITNPRYKRSGDSGFSSFATSFLTINSLTPGITEAVSTAPSLIGVPFEIQFEIASGAVDGNIVQVNLLANSDNAQDAGVLIDNFNNYTDIARQSTAQTSAAVPAPLPLFGAAAAFSTSRRLRRRLARRG